MDNGDHVQHEGSHDQNNAKHIFLVELRVSS